MSDVTEKLQKLREPFPQSAISKLPKGSVMLDFVGHANVTDRFLNIDPLWTWEPVAFDERGLPAMDYDANGKPVGLWIRLTICGVTRLGYGTCEARKMEPVKELIGDALRNAAMRFGVALELWSKAELESQHHDTPEPQRAAPQAAQRPAPQQSAQPQANGHNRPAAAPTAPNNLLTDAQHRAIMGIASRVFGGTPTVDDFAEFSDKPIDELTRNEATALIDRLRLRMAEEHGSRVPSAPSKATAPKKLSGMQELMVRCERAGVCCDADGKPIVKYIQNTLALQGHTTAVTHDNVGSAFEAIVAHAGIPPVETESAVQPEPVRADDRQKQSARELAAVGAAEYDDSDPFSDQ